MEIIRAKEENGILTLLPKGRIDSSNAAQAEAEVKACRESIPHGSVVLDMDELEYISSAGLRVVLRLRKDEPSLRIVNASSEVYEIFEMTGFTEMIPVEKAYRKLSVEGCEVIGEGANGKVYRLDPDTIIKVYNDQNSLPDVHRERELARRAFVLGIPTAIPYDVVRVGDSYGSVFELLNAKSFAKLVKAEPENIEKYIELSVELLKKIHSTVVKPEDMPNMKDVAVDWVRFLQNYLPEDKGAKLLKMVEAVPEDLHMMHGDYHVKNVMLQNGEVLLIDMDTLCHGHPIFELASVFNAYEGFYLVRDKNDEAFLGIPYSACQTFWKRTLELYLDTSDPARIEEVENKAKLMGYARLMRRLIRRKGLETEAGRKEVQAYKNEILELLDKVDTLVF